MMRSSSFRVRGTVLTLVALALAACSDRNPSAPTQPAPTDARHLACTACVGGGGGGIILTPPPPPPFAITSVTLASNTLPIDGVNGSYTATLSNSGAAVSGAVLQGYMVQGSARRAAGGVVVDCHAGSGVLPNGTCQVSFSVGASNTASGSGTLVTGVASFELDLTVTGTTVVVATVGVNLIPGGFSAGGSTTLSLSGALGSLAVNIQNNGSQTVSGLSYQTTVIQGAAHRSAGSMPMSCGLAGWGNLPGFSSCPMTIYLGVTNSTSGSGTLIAGPATFQVQLLQGLTVLSTRSYAMTLVDARFTTVSANPAFVGGGPQPISMAVTNAGTVLSSISAGGVLRQGTAIRSFASAPIDCGAGTGVLPAGTCNATGTYAASNTASGSGTLVPGPATLVLVLHGLDAHGFIYTVDSTTVSITLLAAPTFTSATTGGSAIIGDPGPFQSYRATLDNPGVPIANASVKVRILQNSANRDAFPGSVSVDCGSGAGTIPSGTCTFSSIFFASNSGGGSGTLYPGSATLQIQIFDPVDGMLTTQLVPITLVSQ